MPRQIFFINFELLLQFGKISSQMVSSRKRKSNDDSTRDEHQTSSDKQKKLPRTLPNTNQTTKKSKTIFIGSQSTQFTALSKLERVPSDVLHTILPFLDWRECIKLTTASRHLLPHTSNYWMHLAKLFHNPIRELPWKGFNNPKSIFFANLASGCLRLNSFNHSLTIDRVHFSTKFKKAYGLTNQHLDWLEIEEGNPIQYPLKRNSWYMWAAQCLAYSKRQCSWKSLTTNQIKHHTEISIDCHHLWGQWLVQEKQREVETAKKEWWKNRRDKEKLEREEREVKEVETQTLTKIERRFNELKQALHKESANYRSNSSLCRQWVHGCIDHEIVHVAFIMKIGAWLFDQSQAAYKYLISSCKESMENIMWQHRNDVVSYTWDQCVEQIIIEYSERARNITAADKLSRFDHSRYKPWYV